MIELRSPLQVWLDDEGSWAEVPGISRLAFEEQHAARPLKDELVVDAIGRSRPLTDMWLLDRGYQLPDTWPPTPIERALAILRPHLDNVPLYRAAPTQ